MRLIVSFYSIGSGVEGGEIEKFQVYIVEFGIKAGKEINYWFKYGNLAKNPVKRLLQKAKNRLS